jgi:alkylation response protein AidB-like acyl-CoA dehydrogenase
MQKKFEFFQDAPILENQYETDTLLKNYLKKTIPGEILSKIEPDLINFGNRVIDDIMEMSLEAEMYEPELIQYDPWGKRIDKIVTSKGWTDLHRISAQEGLVGIGYEREYDEYSRIYQFAKLYLYTPSSAIQACPLAMTDAAAKLIEVFNPKGLKEHAFQRLISRDSDFAWTSGQWMTERIGGSDVGLTETVAKKDGDSYKLYGFKWFTSAATSEIAFTLARIEDELGNVTERSKGLSLFYLETHNEDGSYNNIEVERLKDKLGTRALPTAELRLNGTKAQLIGEQGRGVKNITHMLNMTRLYNSVSAIAYLRRILALLKDYNNKRYVFGKLLLDQPLHIETVAELEINLHALFSLTFFTISLLGKEEVSKATEDEKALLRLLTPITKLYTGKIAVQSISEALECFGGAGYMEDTQIPKILRDAQVLAIWEGTTNVLSLDTIRALKKDLTFDPLITYASDKISKIGPEFEDQRKKLHDRIMVIKSYIIGLSGKELEYSEASARILSFSIAELIISILLLQNASWSKINLSNEKETLIAIRWIDRPFTQLKQTDAKYRASSKTIISI